MKPETKLALRRFAIRWLRKLVDVADDRLHTAEVKLREDISNGTLDHRADAVGVSDISDRSALPRQARQKENFLEWEARRSGVAPVSKKVARKRRERMTAAAFDLKYAAR